MSMLAERKSKQKFSINPRGKHWSDDVNKFGQRMLEKMGWSAGKGLGAKENGITEHVHVKHKNDSTGIGFKERDDQWTSHETNFTTLLEELRDDDDGETNGVVSFVSLENKSRTSRTRVHYHKFTRGKDLSARTEKELANILGRKTLDVQKSSDSEQETKRNEYIQSKESCIESDSNEIGKKKSNKSKKRKLNESFDDLEELPKSKKKKSKKSKKEYAFDNPAVEADLKEELCFDNPALNIKQDEEEIEGKKTCKQKEEMCYENHGLDLTENQTDRKEKKKRKSVLAEEEDDEKPKKKKKEKKNNVDSDGNELKKRKKRRKQSVVVGVDNPACEVNTIEEGVTSINNALDNYQNELENNINERKQVRRRGGGRSRNDAVFRHHNNNRLRCSRDQYKQKKLVKHNMVEQINFKGANLSNIAGYRKHL